MPFTYNRTVRFQDTDAAGVVYFANVLGICHEAYEESLEASSINLKDFLLIPLWGFPLFILVWIFCALCLLGISC